jgi:hypothetical protein
MRTRKLVFPAALLVASCTSLLGNDFTIVEDGLAPDAGAGAATGGADGSSGHAGSAGSGGSTAASGQGGTETGGRGGAAGGGAAGFGGVAGDGGAGGVGGAGTGGDGTGGTTYVCAIGDHVCVGADLQTCATDRQGYASKDTCATAALCDAANGVCIAPTCASGEYRCLGGVLQQCNQDRNGWNTVEDCGAAASCSATAGSCCPHLGRGPVMVHLGDYCVDSTEVTNRQYRAFQNSDYPKGTPSNVCAWNTSYLSASWDEETQGDHPVVGVNWCDANAFCAWAGKRLCGKIGGGAQALADYANPNLDEWYRACISGPTVFNVFPYGNTFNATACNGAGYESTYDRTLAVGIATCRSASAPYSSIYDLSGNVDEWVDACSGPSGNGSNDSCRVRGGNASDAEEMWLRCDASVTSTKRGTRYTLVGFRCCATP